MIYTPLVKRKADDVHDYRFVALQANALSSVAGWISLVVTFAFGYLSDKTRIRGPLVIAAIGTFWLFWVAFQQKSLSTDRWLKYGLLIMVQGFNAAYHVGCSEPNVVVGARLIYKFCAHSH